jgi:hypothetical protein
MKFIFTALIGLAAFTACAQDAVTPTEHIELFNGKDFSGLTFFMRSNSPPEKTWEITNGVIHCAGRPPGFLRTEKSYANYQLTVEWRFVAVAPHRDNTGVMVHMQLPDKVWPKCIECQGQNQKIGDYWLQSGATAEGYPSDGKKAVHVPMTSPPNEKPIGEWNTYQITASGDTVESIVNGKSMNKITGCNVSSGFIGIQSEGADIEVRKIFLDPLPRH